MKKKRLSKKTLTVFIIIALVLSAAAAIPYVQDSKPYAITANGNDVVLVSDEETGKNVVKKVIREYAGNQSDIKSITIDKDINVEQLKFWERAETDVLDEAEAVDYIKEVNTGENSAFTATITSEVKIKENFTPKTRFVKDKDMFVGERKINGKTEEGERLVTSEVVTVNGEPVDETVLDKTATDAGEAKEVRIGVKGLPEGEDWKTYKGDPIFYNGEDLMLYAQRFVGVTPYVRGGTSLVTGADCVGCVIEIYKFHGVNLSTNLRKEGHSVSYSEIKPGDIICYPHHFAMYFGNGMMIHAANPQKDVCIEKVHGGITDIRRIID